MKPALLQLLSKFKLEAPVRRDFAVTAKVLSATEGTVEFVASDETLDCYQEIVTVDGWRFDFFERNAPFVDSHDYSSITKLLGQVIDWKVEGGQLIETVKYSLIPDTLGCWAFKMVEGGFLKAVSVGFVPVRMATKWDQSSADFVAAVANLGLDSSTAAKLRAVYLEQQQIELSQCVIGANPNALAKAYKAGCLTEGDLDKFTDIIATSKSITPANVSADADVISPRTKAAILLEIQSHL